MLIIKFSHILYKVYMLKNGGEIAQRSNKSIIYKNYFYR